MGLIECKSLQVRWKSWGNPAGMNELYKKLAEETNWD